MWQRVRQLILWLISFSILLILLLTGVENLAVPAASAAIRQLEEAPGQFVYQSRQTLRDQHSNSWQAIAFKRIRPDGSSFFYLRLVGFPGIAEIDRSQPLELTDSLGKLLTANDASQQIFTDAAVPEPNVGQYDLAPIVSELQAAIPLKLTLPTTQGQPIELLVSPALVQEWQALFTQL
ncbi:hypothetical protein N836_32600 [Leptolyngbya sp. Heron Island J]|nr:hypothetical protein N836_32600 [Leptolyngbya sp. Heron Island J]